MASTICVAPPVVTSREKASAIRASGNANVTTPHPSTPVGMPSASTIAATEISSSIARWHGCCASRYPARGQPSALQSAMKPACFPEQLWWIGEGSAPHSRSSSVAPAFASRLRAASSCSGRARCDAHAIAISVGSRSGQARTTGTAWIGFAALRRWVTSIASPADFDDLAVSHWPMACTLCRASTQAPPRDLDDERLHSGSVGQRQAGS